MKNTVRVEGHKDYVRDKNTGAILNINTSEISIARERKMIRKQKEKELEEMKDSVSELKNEVNEIKSLLNKIVERL
tara:strand:+ start:225 stop:452 length:228 start_codon:yes stop_codon:yes gene_type:complete